MRHAITPTPSPPDRPTLTWSGRISIVLVFAFAYMFIQVTGAKAVVTGAEELATFGSHGSGAGALDITRGIATDPRTGHVYVYEEGNWRISEFTPWGTFVKAFGWDVAPGAVNEQQEVRVRGTEGQFRLHFVGEETTDLEVGASATEVQAALTALVGIGTGKVAVRAAPGNLDGAIPFIYAITFKRVPVMNEPQIGVSASSTLTATARTIANGTPGGTELEACTEESTCRAGQTGAGAGQFGGLAGLAVDAEGDVFARENFNNRVQVFGPSGEFLRMFGEGVNKTTGTDICTREDVEVDHDVCAAGETSGAADSFSPGFGILIGPDGKVYISDKERIQVFNADGTFDRTIAVPTKNFEQIALNPVTGGFYATFEGEPNVGVLSPTGALERTCPVSKVAPLGPIASDASGTLYAVEEGFGEQDWILAFDSNCQLERKFAETASTGPSTFVSLTGLAVNGAGDLYADNSSTSAAQQFIRAFGPGPVEFESPPVVAPTFVGQFATAVQRDGATVAARINPHFWTNTRYYVQYGTGKCSEGGCEAQKPLPPGSLLGTQAVDAPVHTAGVFLEGLSPGTTYHYRFVAESSGGGPVLGEEAIFTTFPEPLGKSPCANEVFRFGFSAPLPDCRAYEMVSPVDKAGGDVKALLDTLNYTTALDKSSTDGNGFTYTSSRAFADPEAAPYVVQYLAARGASGWENKAIIPPQSIRAPELYGLSANLDNEYLAFSSDLCQGWLLASTEPPLAPGGSEDEINLYRRDNCDGGYETVVPGPTGTERVELQGTSADGSAAVVRSNEKLTTNATEHVSETYYASEGVLHLVCVLPSGVPSKNFCSAGTDPVQGSSTPSVSENSHLGLLTNAISADGSRVYWTESGTSANEVEQKRGVGTVYLRENPGAEQSEVSGGECTEAEKACTVAVSGTATTKASRFLGASKDGSRALFEVAEGPGAGRLYEFELGGVTRELAGKGLGVAAMSEDLSRIYFVSEEALSETSGAKAGQSNLYLDEEGTKIFIATLSRTDVSAAEFRLSNVNPEPYYHAARASVNGQSLAFISDRSLTGYDNTDVASPLPCEVKEGTSEGVCDSEVYLYRVGSEGPVCVSCNPSGARPQGRGVARRDPSSPTSIEALAQAASLPLANNQLYLPKGISADGTRVFFNSYDALLPRDTNGKEDVYEWEAASSQQQCEEKTADLFVESSGGCLSLITSGESPQDSEVLDSSADGSDVFFTTNASLLPQDTGLVDVYDAREGGGFPQPVKVAACEGEACQGPYSPPNDPTPASSSFEGAGNVVEKPARKAHKHKKKHAHKKAKQKKRAAKHNRGGQK